MSLHPNTSHSVKVGVVSDTHGYLNPGLAGLLEDVDLILHAGDICGSHVISALEEIAHVVAVSGNNDVKTDTSTYPQEVVLELTGQRIQLMHQYKCRYAKTTTRCSVVRRLGSLQWSSATVTARSTRC